MNGPAVPAKEPPRAVADDLVIRGAPIDVVVERIGAGKHFSRGIAAAHAGASVTLAVTLAEPVPLPLQVTFKVPVEASGTALSGL